MANVLLYYLIVINIVTFLVYGIDKAASKRGQSQTRLSYAEREQARPKVKLKAKQGNWRISEATLLMLASIVEREQRRPKVNRPWLAFL